MNNFAPPFVSVIIPVYNDAVRLQTCLQALEEQTYPKQAYEVIAVDNGSDESIEPIVAGFRQAKASSETRRGSYAARNKGITLAQGDILTFTDSDCIPARDWLERGVANLLREPPAAIVGGKVTFIFKDPAHPTAAELYDSIWHLNQKSYVEKLHFSATANLFTFKSVFERVGYFNSALKSGGDYEWGQRATAVGYTLIYADDVRVAHPARASLKQLRQKVKRVTSGMYALKKQDHVFIQRFNRDFFMRFLPPVFTVMRLKRDQKADTKELMKVLLIWLVIQAVKIQENVRLTLWGNP